MPTIAIIGGSGPEGRGLGLRFAMAGHQVVLGSRSADRAAKAVDELMKLVPDMPITGAVNAEAAQAGEWVVLSVPHDGLSETVQSLKPALDSKLLVSVVAPLKFVKGLPTAVQVPEGSAAQQVAGLLPKSNVVAAFHHVSAQDLLVPNRGLEGDVIVCGDDDEAKQEVMALAKQIVGLRAIDGGPLVNARYVEELTALLLYVNKVYHAHSTIRLVGV